MTLKIIGEPVVLLELAVLKLVLWILIHRLMVMLLLLLRWIRFLINGLLLKHHKFLKKLELLLSCLRRSILARRIKLHELLKQSLLL